MFLLLFSIISIDDFSLLYTHLLSIEKYPPPQLLAKWKPVHDVCVGKTGASEGVIYRDKRIPFAFTLEHGLNVCVFFHHR